MQRLEMRSSNAAMLSTRLHATLGEFFVVKLYSGDSMVSLKFEAKNKFSLPVFHLILTLFIFQIESGTGNPGRKGWNVSIVNSR